MKKIFSLFLALMLMLLPASTVFADNVDEKINISVRKYMYIGNDSIDDNIINNGTELDIKNNKLSIYDTTKYGRVAFSLYKIEDTSKVPEDKTAQQVAFEVQDAVLNDKELPYDAKLVKADIDVDKNGEALFTNIDNNKNYGYILIETVSSALVKQIANPMFIKLPMINPNGSGYIKDTIYLYPKNNIKLLELNFNKLQQGNKDIKAKALEGAQFKLYIGEPGKGKVVKESSSSDKDLILTTDKDGKFSIPGLISCKFYLVEQPVKDLTDEGGVLLIGGDARNDEYNKLYFEVDRNGNITTSDDFIDYVNYSKPEIKKEMTNNLDDFSYNVYEEIGFKITMSVPRNSGEYSKLYIEDKLISEDKVTEYARYIDNSFILKADNNMLEEGKDYSMTKTENTFKINFLINNKVSSKVASAKEVTIEYKAQLVPGLTPSKKYTNDATVTFNNSSHGNNEDKTDKHTGEKNEFTSYGFIVKKVNDGLWRSNVSPEGVKGAKFILLDDKSNVYKGPKEECFGPKGSDDYVLISDDKGIIKVDGLKKGTYILREIEAAEGFELPEGKDADTQINVGPESHLDKNIINIKNIRKEFAMTGREQALTTILTLSMFLIALVGIYAVVSRKIKKTI